METTKQPIDFKPLSEGLGFHPFADGLPYAPVVKQVPKKELPVAAALNAESSNLGPLGQLPMGNSMGAGAISAGRATPVKPGQGPVAGPARSTTPARAAAARVNVPVATASVAGISAPAAAPAPYNL